MHVMNESKVKIAAGKLFDPYLKDLQDHQIITINVNSGLIEDVQPASNGKYDLDFTDPKVIDLRHLTVLPGFVDVHVHFFLHPYSETSWEDQLTKESVVERTLRASIHAKKTLMAGYTAVRDLGTEGAGDADIHLRKCLSGPNPLVPGPRYFCANRAIACTGSYGPKSSIYPNQEGIDGITGAEVADNKDECIKAVRRQIGAGADWIKIYAGEHLITEISHVEGRYIALTFILHRFTTEDYRFRSRVIDVSTDAGQGSISTFSEEELEAMIKTSHRCGVKVAAHATNEQTIETLLRLGVDSIEHGYDKGRASMNYPSRTVWVPTLSAYYTMGGSTWDRAAQTFMDALSRNGETIACGGDTGVFAHGENALEMKLMVALGANWRDVLKLGTLGGWECIRSMRWEGSEGEARLKKLPSLKEDARIVGDNEMPFGAVRKGFAADIIATSGDLEAKFDSAVSADQIAFVMKGGRVYKRDGKELV